MDSQKGSVKDRLRARKLFLTYKKNKKKKEKELLKKKKQEKQMRIKAEQIRLYGKYYSKPKVFGLTVLGLFLGLFEPKNSNKKIEEKLNNIEKAQKQIFLRLEQDAYIEEVYQSIDNTYQKLEDIKKKYKRKLVLDNFNPLHKDKIINKIDQKQKELIVANEICHNKAKQIKKKESIITSNNTNISLNGKRKESINVSLNDNLDVPVKNTALANDKVLQKKQVNKTKNALPSIKTINSNMKDYSKEYSFLKSKIDQEKEYNSLFTYEFKLKQLLKRYKLELEKYSKLKEQYNLEELNDILDIETLDKFELRKSEKAIVNKINECENLLIVLENKKSVLSSNLIKNTKNDDVKKIEKKEQKSNKKPKLEEERQELKEQYDDIYMAHKMIINNIMEERKVVDKLKRKLSGQSAIVRKKSVFFSAKKFTNSILNFGFSLLPFKYFRNRRLGLLVSSVMLNNSLRTTRKILTLDAYEENYLLYNNIIKEIKTNEDYIQRTYDVCLNSLNQIQSIKTYLHSNYSMAMEYDSELLDFNSKLDRLANTLEEQMNSLENINRNYAKVHEKVKVLKNNQNY